MSESHVSLVSTKVEAGRSSVCIEIPGLRLTKNSIGEARICQVYRRLLGLRSNERIKAPIITAIDASSIIRVHIPCERYIGRITSIVHESAHASAKPQKKCFVFTIKRVYCCHRFTFKRLCFIGAFAPRPHRSTCDTFYIFCLNHTNKACLDQ